MRLHFREMSLGELLDDPLVQLVMASDGVEDMLLRRLIQTIRHARRMRLDEEVDHAGLTHRGESEL